MNATRTCSINGCERSITARGMCNTHYRQWLSNQPERPKCATEGCEKASEKTGLCAKHYAAWRRDNKANPRKCSIPGCGEPHQGRGLCGSHYQKWRSSVGSGRTCEVDGCDLPYAGRGMCARHYKHWQHTGEFGGTIRRQRPKNMALRDAFDTTPKTVQPDGCIIWGGAQMKVGYGQIGFGKRKLYAHRVAWELHTGETIPKGMQIDHRCHNRMCVNPEHLRLVTPKQNCENHSGPRSDSSTGIRGVYYIATTGRYRAAVKHFGHNYNLGDFDCIDDAANAVLLKRIELFTHNDIDRASPGEGGDAA